MKVSQLKKNLFFLMIFLSSVATSYAQQTGLKGKIVDASSNANLFEVLITIEGTLVSTTTNTDGEFDFGSAQLPFGEQVAVISKEGYVTKRFPIIINEGSILDLKTIDLDYDLNQEQIQIGTISLSDNELDDGDDNASFNVSGLLQASRDVFLSAAAFDFSATFFRPRGLGNENGKVLINGIEMNKFSTGRPQWSNWGGLNDVQRNQEFSMGIAANDYTFGDLSGTTNIIMRASQYRKGGRISYAASNRSYTGRMMASYSSGLMSDGWAYTVSLARRMGTEGFIDGTLYDANSIFASVEKKINDKHSINLTSFYTPNRRGRSTAITEEVFNLRGRKYNPNWGYFDGEKKNSRIREIEEPVAMLNHYWNITNKTTLNTNVGFQTGKIGNSRIDNGGTDLVTFNGQDTYVGGGRSRDTNPMHPSNLPSFYLQDANPTPLDFQNAFLAQQRFRADGQLDWNNLIEANQLNRQQGGNSTYILYEDRNDDTQWTFNTILNSQVSDNISINGSINYRTLKSENFAEVLDLLGGTGFLDVDGFALDNPLLSSSQLADRAQSDLRNRNRLVGVGDRYDYNYEIDANTFGGFAQAQFKFNRVDFFLGGNVSQTSYQRNGLFQNGYFPNNSFGKGEKLEFTNYGAKAGLTYKINGRNLIDVHGTYFTKAPTIRNAYANVRQNNITVSDIVGGDQESEKIQSFDASYILRTPKLKARVTGYYTKIEDATDIGFFFTNAISGSFVQEILTDIDKLHIGAEFGIEYQITPTIKLKAAAAIGQFTFDNNPNLTLTSTSEGFTNLSQGAVIEPAPRSFGKSFLEDYNIAGGPQNAAQFGFEYRDPNFWWVGATTNYFSNAYIDVSPLTRTENFSIDPETEIPFNDYDENIARELLRQEQFDDYFLVNVVGGKSWRVKDYYIGFFATINNVFNQEYRTGGFEQARNADYRAALEESQRDTPVFGSRYFYGFGTSYYLNVYVRF
ncbi:carboxypeptidase-like regulatory domain-containing protein [Aquimarina sp. 2201CG14-23]|uniref:carboxypeptidase-like regulatory domain-containing protein n=1 Tax=Aquimarina mycalae TaxID=3040073 RepID=UPI00247809AE|nr:carboxypeptidase-like regulatory domain-containing protein [Aquimarina sp. 2201CG14-23]MDH7446295.1 carboxypeptidase-like regulatory domain-containing protein [Aquimarina sp. 2201CG14-23]